MNYYKRHIGDYLKDTAHLSLLEHGIYTRLLDVYYTREGAIPSKQAARLIGARTNEEQDALQCVLEEYFAFDKDRDAWVQHRCETEIAEKNVKAETNRENGKKGGRPKNEPKQEPKPNNLDGKQNPPETESVIDGNPNGFENETNGKTQTEPTNNLSHKPLTNNQELKPEDDLERGCKPFRAQTRTTLPLDFTPDEQALRLARQHKLDADLEREKFVAHYTANAEQRDNWQALFRKWLLNAMQYAADRAKVTAAKTQAIDQRDTSRQAAARSVFGNVGGQNDERIIDGEFTAR